MSVKITLLKNTGYNLAGYFYLLLTSFFSISILLQNLGRDLFGLYVLLVSVIGMSSVFDFGLSAALIRKLSLNDIGHEEKRTYWQTSLFLFLTISSMVALIAGLVVNHLSINLYIFHFISRQTAINVNISLFFLIFFNNLNNHFLSLPQANHRFDIFNSKSFLVGSANTIFSAWLSYFYPRIDYIFYLQLIFHIITLSVLIKYSQSTFSFIETIPKIHRQAVKDLFHFGFRNFIGTLAGQVEAQFSNFMLGAMVSAQAVTSFNIPQSIVTKGAGIISQFSQAFFPLSSSLMGKDRILKLRQLYLSVQGLTLFIGIMSVFAAHYFGHAFLLFWLKDVVVVEAATPVLKTLSWYFLLLSLTPIPTSLLQGLNKPQIPSFFAVLTVTVEIVISIFLIPKYQAVGIAIAFLTAQLITTPIFLYITWNILQKEIQSHYN